ncbi:YveK family protein [Pseudoneobacillus rhizosphaerae]|uniref:Capsular polysaccharide biosynthesis protein YwqC n=1 Tax=Pseudoneobacillus rhizosphaerae TaxID=2880968 RepID=A0A9C7G6T3_9BACI|nr:Wzz/FepE/Etk N-terminal domain-containing protein [Pseudoneobacillus rhizosphaerae]CAG9606605.1 putative capsular polysaccharide biosynthesis protein YwqC [Pseudoneobacillus rhizosphaerae]
MEETISLRELFYTLRKRIWMIISIAVVATLASGIISFYVLTPIYSSSTQLLVNKEKSDQPMYNVGEIQTNLQLINTYNVIIKSPAILDLVAKELDMDVTSEQLNAKITVGSEKDSQVLSISVQDADPQMATDIANTTAKVFQNEIVKIMNVDNVSILAQAKTKENPSPIKPRPLLNIAIALVVGLMAGVGLTFLLEYLDNTIKNEMDVEKVLGLPVLGAIHTMSEKDLINGLGNKQQAEVRGESFGV